MVGRYLVPSDEKWSGNITRIVESVYLLCRVEGGGDFW